MNDGKIYITISDKRKSADGNSIKGRRLEDLNKLPQKLKVDTTSETLGKGVQYLQHEMFHIVKQQASEMINYSISNIGNFTGNYQAQREVQNALNIGGTLSGIAMAGLYVGAYTINPILGLFASTVALGTYVINYDRQERANSFRVKRQNREIAVMRDISGLNSLTNGGRIGD